MDRDALLIAVHSSVAPGPCRRLCLLDRCPKNREELHRVRCGIRAAYDLVIISRYHDDGWRLRDIEALSQIEIGLDLGGKRAVGSTTEGIFCPCC